MFYAFAVFQLIALIVVYYLLMETKGVRDKKNLFKPLPSPKIVVIDRHVSKKTFLDWLKIFGMLILFYIFQILHWWGNFELGINGAS